MGDFLRNLEVEPKGRSHLEAEEEASFLPWGLGALCWYLSAPGRVPGHLPQAAAEVSSGHSSGSAAIGWGAQKSGLKKKPFSE